MSNSETKVRSSLRNFILALVLLLSTNILMGVILINMSRATLREQINQRMLDVANSASALLNGDEIKTIDAQDAGTEKYERAMNVLRAFQDNIELDYIYGIEENTKGVFTLAIDPDRDDPAQFGEPILATDALINAAAGKPDVDKEPHSDRWGSFYSAYSPIYDSEGNIAGIVGVDFSSKWYDEMLSSNKSAAVILTMVAMTVGIVLSFIIMSQNRQRFMQMLLSLQKLENETKKLDRVIMKSSIKKLNLLPDGESEVLKKLASGENVKQQFTQAEDYSELNASIENVYNKLKQYLEYVESEVYIDDGTGTQNKAAYRLKVKKFGDRIEAGVASFSVAFFDINGMKKIYTHSGYEAGDKLLFECGKMLKETFGDDNVYHITGDEYIVLMSDTAAKEMKSYLAAFDRSLKKYNEEHRMENLLSVTYGFSVYDPKKHKDYRSVFIDTKAEYDKNLAAFRERQSRKNLRP